jgi:hypothetical protein
VKSGQILGQNNAPLDKAAYNRTYPRMNNQLGKDEHRKCNEESDMHFNVVKEGKATEATSRGAEHGEEQQRQPCDQRDDEQSAMQEF